MDVGRIFPGGGKPSEFFQIFPWGEGKSGDISFFPLEAKKKTFVCWNFRNPCGQGSSLPTPLPTPMMYGENNVVKVYACDKAFYR